MVNHYKPAVFAMLVSMVQLLQRAKHRTPEHASMLAALLDQLLQQLVVFAMLTQKVLSQ